jgi:hypothetical protein
MKRDIDALVDCMQQVFWVMKWLVLLWRFLLLSDLSSPSKRIIRKAETTARLMKSCLSVDVK